MNTQDNSNPTRIAVLGTLLISVITLTILPRGLDGFIFIMAVAGFSGLMAALFFVANSVAQLKKIAEDLSGKFEAEHKDHEQVEQAAA